MMLLVNVAMTLVGMLWVQADLQKYVAALSRPYSKRTKAELAESLLDAVQQHRDSHVLQGEGGQNQSQVQPQKQRASEVATGGLEVSKEAAKCFELTAYCFASTT